MADHAAGRKSEQSLQRKLAFSEFSDAALVRNPRLTCGERRDHAPRKRLRIVHLLQQVEDTPIHQPEVSGILNDIIFCSDFLEEFIVKAPRRLKKQRLNSLNPDSDDYIVTRLPPVEEAGYHGRWILQVAIYLDCGHARGGSVPGK